MLLSRLIPLSALAATLALAQPAADIVNPPGKPTLEDLKAAALTAETVLPAAKAEPKALFDISDAQRERLTQFLPRTLLKLNRRERVHIVVLGDAMLDGADSIDHADPLLASFPGAFASRLATQFYYTGGVRVVRSESTYVPKKRAVFGPEIVLQPVRASSMVQATAALTSEGFQGVPDIVLVALGFEDALTGTPLADVESGLRGVIEAARSKNIEVIVAGPMLQASEPAESSLASTRGVSSLLSSVCASENVIFSDLGDLSRLIAPPAGVTEAHRTFPALARQYQTRLHAELGGELATATTELHESMGSILFEDTLNGQPGVPWEISGITGKPTSASEFQLDFQIRNPSKTPLKLTVLPLVSTAWKPTQAHPDFTLAPAESKTSSISYSLISSSELPLSSNTLRFPLLIISGQTARIHDATTPMVPVSVVWQSRTVFNHEGVFSPGIEINNPGKSKVSGTWSLNFNGQDSSGKFALEADGQETLDLKLQLGLKDAARIRQRLPLKLQIDVGGQKHDFSREVEIVRNLGLKHSAPLTAADGQETGATIQFDADSQRLFLTCDLNGLDLSDDGSASAFHAILHIDARRYGQRLAPGATAGIHIRGSAGDGDATVEAPAVWAFGTGYAAHYDPAEIKATLSSSPSGVRRLAISLPRSYLYDHEWALDNGNSQLGVNFTLDAAGRSLFLTRSTRHPDDAESLTVLELTEKPTQRVTVRVE